MPVGLGGLGRVIPETLLPEDGHVGGAVHPVVAPLALRVVPVHVPLILGNVDGLALGEGHRIGLLRAQAHHQDPMARDGGLQAVLAGAQVLVGPKVTDSILLLPEVDVPGEIHRLVQPVVVQVPDIGAPIQEAHGDFTVRKGFRPDLLVPHVHETDPLLAQRVLVHCNDFLVGEDL